ncbi:MAG: hypothetical protein M1832_003699 [Thelocarpon impressellum]|nr:MAG: hypothetical protein M1832_003699 [Thelocarpon impressellum]
MFGIPLLPTGTLGATRSRSLIALSLFLLAVVCNGQVITSVVQPSSGVQAPAAPTSSSLPKVSSSTLKVTNQCPEAIYPAFLTQSGNGPDTSGFKLDVGSSKSSRVSGDWQGRVWGRTNCTFDGSGTDASNKGGLNGGGQACLTGDCNGLIDCDVSGSTPVTLAEFLLRSGTNQAFYDISLVDGYNLPLAIVFHPSPALSDIPPNLTNPVCIGTAALLASEGYNPYSSSATSVLGANSSFPLPFNQKVSLNTVSRWCPWGLQLLPPKKPASGIYPYPDDSIMRPSYDPCLSACAKSNAPSDCCTGLFNSPGTCKPSMYSMNAKEVCPDAYSYAYDDQSSTFVIPSGGDFEVVFCPPGRSTNILATKAAQLLELSQTGKVDGSGVVQAQVVAAVAAVASSRCARSRERIRAVKLFGRTAFSFAVIVITGHW